MRQLTAIFLIVLIAGSSASTLQSKLANKQSILNDIQNKNSQFYALLEEGSKYVVDEVLSLLSNLEDSAKNELSKLNNDWVEQKALLEQIQEQARQAWLKQQSECNRLEAEQHALEYQIKIREEETNANNQQIAVDAAKIQTMKEERCKSNNLYIDHIIDHRDALLLFGVLRKAIEGYQPGSFVQLANFKQNVATLGDFINIFAQQHNKEFQQIMSQLRQVDSKFHSDNLDQKVNDFASNSQYNQADRVQERSNVGTGHVDNDKQQIKLDDLNQDTVRSLSNVKGQLLKVLDEITAVEENKKKTQEVEEANANEAAASFKSKLQDEQRRLTRRNEVLAVELAQLRTQLAAKVIEVNNCRAQEARLLSAYNLAQQNLKEATARYEARKAVLEQEIILFNRLHLYYQDKVANVATQADRERVQDHVDNQNFNKTASYTAKQTSDFNHLKNNVDETFKNQAEQSVQ